MTFTWKIDDDKKVMDGDTLVFGFKKDENTFSADPFVIQNVGQVTHGPDASFEYTFPAPLPAEWTSGVEASVPNDGKDHKVYLWIHKMGDDGINSESKITQAETDKDFDLRCCETAGGKGCQCRPDMSCDAGFRCATDGGARICEELMVGKVGHMCHPAGAEKRCNDANAKCENEVCVAGPPPGACMNKQGDKWSTGDKDCPCAEIPNVAKCANGLKCDGNQICRTSAAAPLAGLACNAASNPNTALNDVCITHEEGAGNPNSNTPPFSCQGGPGEAKCAMCTPGTKLCTCNGGSCGQSPSGHQMRCIDVANHSPRCFEEPRCENCPCEEGSRACNSGLTCVSNKCIRQSGPPPPPPPPPQDQQQECSRGAENCPCAVTQDGQKGCTVKGLRCQEVDGKGELCVSGATANVLAFSALALALSRLFL